MGERLAAAGPAALSKTALELRNIVAGYGSRQVLHHASLQIPAGSLMALLGPSGCGKTTLLRVAAGLVLPTSGSVFFDDMDTTAVPVEKREISMVFQKPLLFPHLDVEGNVAFGLTMRKVGKRAAADAVATALDMVQLGGLQRRRVTELSGGQEQRVALARALVLTPRVLLLDEPFAALDAQLRKEMRHLVRNLQRSLGMTTIFVTHDQEEAGQIADTVALMLEGRVEQCGTMRAFYEAPRSAPAARFFGWQHVITSDGSTVFFRPEAAVIIDDTLPPLRDTVELRGTILDVVDAGTKLMIRVQPEAETPVEVHAAPGLANQFRTGQRIRIALEPQAILRF